MPPSQLRGAARSLWSRRWFRRLTYALASGAALAVGTNWTLHRPFVGRWALRQLDRTLREETGLSFSAERVDLFFLDGRVVVEDLALGGDLLRARRLELRIDPLSLLGRHLRIPRVVLEDPELHLDARRLAAIRLKPRPEGVAKTYVRLGTLAVRRGRVHVQEPAWGPELSAGLDLEARGTGDNRAEGRLRLSDLHAGPRNGGLEGVARVEFSVSDEALAVRGATLVLGASQVGFLGQLAFKGGHVRATGSGSLHLGQAAALARASVRPEGRLDFRGDLEGTLAAPRWRLACQGRGLALEELGLEPLRAEVDLEGAPGQLRVSRLACEGAQVDLAAAGEWREGQGTRLHLEGRRLDLSAAAAPLKAPLLASVSGTLEGDLALPGAPWQESRLDQVTLSAACTFSRASQQAGRARIELKGGLLRADGVELDLPELGFRGHVAARVGARAFRDLEAEGTLRTDAALVAGSLAAWKVTELDMSGATTVEARAGWEPKGGWRVEGRVEVRDPRWHGAQAELLTTEVRIRDQQLFLSQVDVTRAEGRATGELWLSFQRRPEGQDEIDMCFQAFRLPVEEGLKAADLKPAELKDGSARATERDLPISGIASATVRIHGPYRQLHLRGTALAEACEVYGMTVPAFSGGLDYDIAGGRLDLQELRVAESLEQLAHGEEAPRGLLALSGGLRMDLARKQWQGGLAGNLDSGALGLPGPRFQARVDARLEGPWTAPFASKELPEGSLRFERGRLFFGEQSIEGLEGGLEHREGRLQAGLRSQGKPQPIVDLELWQTQDRMLGTLALQVDARTVDTGPLASRLTGDLLRDGRLDLRLEGGWTEAQGLRWGGTLHTFWAGFDGFELTQARPARVQGDAGTARLDLELLGRTRLAGKPQEGPPGVAGRLRLDGGLPLVPGGPLGLRLRGDMGLANLKAVLGHLAGLDPYSLLADLKPAGDAVLDLTLGGSYGNPRLDGTLSLAGGRLEARTYPQSIEDLAFTLRFQGRDVVVPKEDPVRGTFAEGTLRAWGKATWDFGGLSDYDVKATLRDFQFRDIPEGFELAGSLEASLQGNDLDGGLLKGTVNAKRMLYRQDISLRDLILAGAMGGAGFSAADPENPLARIGLDLALRLEEPWEFDTNLLKLQGRPVNDFRIQGTLAKPGLKGKMAFLPGGRLTNLLPAGDVVLEQGTLDFPDPGAFNPVLDLQGRVDIPPYVVNLGIRGNLEGLDFRPSSTPSLRQDEITAILVDPGLASTIGSTAASTTQAASYGLASTGTGLITTLALAEFQDRLRRSLNLDRVNVAWRPGSAGNSETSVTVGKSFVFGPLRVPLVFTHRRAGELQTLSGQVEWRLGSFVLQLGASQSGSTGLKPSGELRHTWSPK